MAKLTYDNKVNSIPSSVDPTLVGRADDFNEIKQSVNDLYDAVGAGTASDNLIVVSINTVGPTNKIKNTLDAIVDSSADKPYLVQVRPGGGNLAYIEDDFVIPPYTALVSDGGPSVTVIESNTTIGVQVTMSEGSTFRGFVLKGKLSGTAIQVTGNGHIDINEIIIEDVTDGIVLNNPATDVYASKIILRENVQGILNDGVRVEAGIFDLDDIHVETTSTIGNSIAKATGLFSLLGVSRLNSFSSNVQTGIRVEDQARSNLNDFSLVYQVNGIIQSGGSKLTANNIKSFNFSGSGYVYEEGTGGVGEVTFASILLQAAQNGLDVNVISPNLLAVGGPVQMRAEQSFIHPDADVTMQIYNMFPGDESSKFISELHVGSVDRPSESVFGEGDSYASVTSMNVYTYDGGAVYSNVTEEASSATGSTFTLPNGNVNSGIYISSNFESNGDLVKHPGIKISIEDAIDGAADVTVTGVTSPFATAGDYFNSGSFNGEPLYLRGTADSWLFYTQGYWCLHNQAPTAGINYYDTLYISPSLEGLYNPLTPNTGQPTVVLNTAATSPFVIEYYNGETTLWEPISYSMNLSSTPFSPYGKNIFALRGSFQLRYDLRLARALVWTLNDPVGLGFDKYWIRYRLISSITTPPVIQQIKLHSNRTEVNEDGFIEFFGKSRPFRSLPWDAGLLEAAGSSPGNQDLFVSDNLDRGYVENSFTASAVDRMGFNTFLPIELDTSTPIVLRWAVMGSGVAGNVEWNVRWGWTNEGANVYASQAAAPATGPNEQLLTLVVEGPADEKQKTYRVDLDVSDAIATKSGSPGDVLWVTLERNGPSGSDTYNGDVNLLNLEPLYASYIIGGHID